MAESMENSLVATSSDFYDNIAEVCQPCSFEGKCRQADRFCVDCNEYLCKKCHTYHKALRSTRNHVLVTNDDAKKITPVTTKDKCSYKCNVHNGKSIKYFCASHLYLGCSACVIQNHKQCKQVDYIPEEAEDIKNLDGFKKFDENLNTLETACKASIGDVESKLKQLGSDESQLKVVLKNFRRKMNNVLDKLENDITRQAKQINFEETKKLNVLSKKLASFLTDVDALLQQVDSLICSGKHCDTYVLMKKEASHLAALNDELVNTTTGKTYHRYYEFQPNNEIFKAGALGKLRIHTDSNWDDCADDRNEDTGSGTGSAGNNVYDMSATVAAAGLPMPPSTMAMTSNSNQQQSATVPAVQYSAGSTDSSKLTRVDAQSPKVGSIQTTQQSATGQSAAHQQQQQQQSFIHLNYGYYYPPNSLNPGAGFQHPMMMPQVTNAAHAGTPANSQYQQKKYGSHHVQYGTNKVYDDLSQQTPDFSKSPYGGTQTQPKANVNTTATAGTGSSDIPGYGKTHAQNSLQDNIGGSLTGSELTGISLSDHSLAGSSLVGTNVNNSLATGTSVSVNSLSGTSLPVNSLTGGACSTSLRSGNSLTGSGLNVSSLTGSLTSNSLSSVSQSMSVPSSGIPTSTAAQNALQQQQERQKPLRSKLPPPSKSPASALEMHGHMITSLDVQFGSNLEFGSDSSPFSFGGNESVTIAYSSSPTSSTSSNNSHVNAQQVGQVPLSKKSEPIIPSSIMSGGLEQRSPRSSTIYQQSSYSTPTKQNNADTKTKLGNRRSKSAKDKGTFNSQTIKSDGTAAPMKTIQATAEQVALNNLISNNTDDSEQKLKNKISQIVELTGCTQERAEIALFDHKNDLDRAANHILLGGNEVGEWRESGKKKKKQSHKGFRDQSDNYRRPLRRNDNRPPRMSRGRGRGVLGERSDRGDQEGICGGSMGDRGGIFRSGNRFEKNNQFDNGPQIDTWTNETSELVYNRDDWDNIVEEDWNEDTDS